MALPVKIARPPRTNDVEEWRDWAEEVERVINLLLAGAFVGSSEVFTPTNVTTDRAIDADSTSIDELADVLGTLLTDLQDAGVID